MWISDATKNEQGSKLNAAPAPTVQRVASKGAGKNCRNGNDDREKTYLGLAASQMLHHVNRHGLHQEKETDPQQAHRLRGPGKLAHVAVDPFVQELQGGLIIDHLVAGKTAQGCSRLFCHLRQLACLLPGQELDRFVHYPPSQ